MAVDTRDKRASVLGVGCTWRVVLPSPNGSVDAGDRKQVATCYRLTTTALIPVPTVFLTGSVQRHVG